MAQFQVVSIIDADTIRVSPKWSLNNGQQGDIVKIAGYPTPPESMQGFRTRVLRNLVLNKRVELKNSVMFLPPDSEALLSHVYLDGVNITTYLIK
jgi:hypothetical protein